MKTQRVVSREYKVMLLADRFAGSERELVQSAKTFWRDFSKAASQAVLGASGTLGRISKRRLIAFYDTRDRLLNRSDYIFRRRSDASGANPEITLKFRHGDRHVAEHRRMKNRRGRGAETKFEEDIKPPFVSLYSYSTSVPVRRRKAPDNLGALARLFPDLRKRVNHFDEAPALEPVRNFTARELVLTGGTLKIGATPKVTAECALIVWYDKEAGEAPQAVEFSYRYGNRRAAYGGATARRAHDAFRTLQSLEDWVDPHPQTKTAFVMEGAVPASDRAPARRRAATRRS